MPIGKKIRFLSTAALALCISQGLSAQANAQDALPIITSVESNYIGGGVGVVPDYVGSDDYEAAVFPAFRYNFGHNRNIILRANYLTANVLDNETLHFGPALRYRLGRDSVDDDAVDSMKDIDDTIEAGAFVSGNWIINNDPRNRASLSADALWDVGGEYSGFVASVSGRYWMPVSKKFDFMIGGDVDYGDDNFMTTYFSVDAADSARSGLSTYTAEEGITSFSVLPALVYHINDDWHLGGGVKYKRLTGDAEDSPVVDDRGDKNQFLGALALIYTWDTKVHRRY